MFDYQPYFVGQETRAMKTQVPGHANATQPSCVDSSFTVEMHKTSPVSLLLCLFSWPSYSHPFLSSPERLDGSGRLILDLRFKLFKSASEHEMVKYRCHWYSYRACYVLGVSPCVGRESVCWAEQRVDVKQWSMVSALFSSYHPPQNCNKNPDTQEHQMSRAVSNSGGAKEKRLKYFLLELKKW